jgi:hypothetical protein
MAQRTIPGFTLGTDEEHENAEAGQLLFQAKFKPSTSKTQALRVTIGIISVLYR